MFLFVRSCALVVILGMLSTCNSLSTASNRKLFPNADVPPIGDDRYDVSARQDTERTFEEYNAYYGSPSTITSRSGFFSGKSSGDPTRVAILLPLSGKYSNIGKSLLDSAHLAVSFLNEPSMSLIPYDTKGNALTASQVAQKAIDEGAKLIIGPVFSKTARAVSRIAVEHNVNVLSFSNDKKLARTGVYALGFRPALQVRRAIRYALQQDIEDFAAIAPNNGYGAEIAKILRTTVGEYPGASVLKTEIYRLTSKGQPVRLAKHVGSAVRAVNTKMPQKYYDEELEKFEDIPIKFPRALLIPEGGSRLKAILANLEKQDFDPEKIVLIGTSQWKDSDITNNPILEGAMVVAPGKANHDRFLEEFVKIYNYQPSAIASLAYDAVALATTLASSGGEDGFARSAISNPRGFAGIDGIFRFDPDGLAERGFALYKVSDGKLKELSESPSDFSGDKRWYDHVMERRQEWENLQAEKALEKDA